MIGYRYGTELIIRIRQTNSNLDGQHFLLQTKSIINKMTQSLSLLDDPQRRKHFRVTAGKTGNFFSRIQTFDAVLTPILR